MVPSANLLGFAGGELAKKLPKVFGVLLETTLSSVVEIVLFMVLIHNDNNGNLIPVIQAAILGSVLANLLLCLGLCFFFGGMGREHQSFHEAVSEVGTGLLLVAGFGLLIPSAFFSALSANSSKTTITNEVLSHSTLVISRATAVILLVAFLMYLVYNLHSHHSIFDEVLELDEHKDEDREEEMKRAKLTLVECFVAISVSIACVCMSAVFLVQEIEHIVHERGVSDNFMGLILVPLVEKAAEHLTAIDEAWDNQINFALFHCLGPSIQTALLNAPLAVLVGWGLGKEMGLNFEIFMIVLVVLSILVVGNFLRDGKSNWLEGGLCVLIYVIIAVTTCQLNDQTNTLIIALKDRDIPLKYAEVESAFTDGKEAAVNEKWVMEHLNHDTLLSQEELTLYTKLESTGSLQNIMHNPDTNADRPLLDEDVRKAIDSLNDSTAVIQKQKQILASQCDNIDKELRRKGEREVRRSTGIEHLRQRYKSERQSTNAVSIELAQEVTAGLKTESENTAVDSKRILSTLAAWLKEDDRALVDLERLGSGMGSTGDDASVVKRTSELSTILADCLAEEIQCRLDRVYLENLRAGLFKANQNLNGAVDEVTIALEGELESLYPEIDMLAEMYTKQQYTAPISRALQNHHDQWHIASHKKLNYILDLVAEMTLSTERLTKSLQDRESFCGTLETFNTTYRTKVGNQFSEISVPRREDIRRRSIQPTLAYTPAAKRIDSVSESHALAAVLRRTGLSSESVFQPEEGNVGTDVLFDARHHMFDCLQNYGIAADAPLVTEMISGDQATRLLSSSLNVNSHVKTLLTSDIHEAELSDLRLKLEHVQKGVEMLDLGVVLQRDRSRETFVERWGLT
ncbi:vacuolar H+/Ca2+ exchanger [Aspergillus pseudocaelatus]|uniref:Vacuolar H+/Ca2+ exchanger n=1 Tax=Aspergillus pseudocaelatus TaxID=1825620 RepID=A0ABQ6W4M4_9EURO|nr:vacuolar H+/Ca2+ exchanger [Aspergillus pseudocaelatus]